MNKEKAEEIWGIWKDDLDEKYEVEDVPGYYIDQEEKEEEEDGDI